MDYSVEYMKPASSVKAVILYIASNVLAITAPLCLIFGLVGVIGTAIFAIASIVMFVVLIITMSRMFDNINTICGDEYNRVMPFVVAVILGILTFNFFYIYYFYKAQTMIHEGSGKYGVNVSQSGGTIILWCILGVLTWGILMVIPFAIVINSYNRVADAYNKGYGLTAPVAVDGPTQYDPLPTPQPVSIPQATSTTKYLVRCTEGELMGASIVLGENETLTIGRDATAANLIVPASCSKVGRMHCHISYDKSRNMFKVTSSSSNSTKLSTGEVITKNGPSTAYVPEGTSISIPNGLTFVVSRANNYN